MLIQALPLRVFFLFYCLQFKEIIRQRGYLSTGWRWWRRHGEYVEGISTEASCKDASERMERLPRKEAACHGRERTRRRKSTERGCRHAAEKLAQTQGKGREKRLLSSSMRCFRFDWKGAAIGTKIWELERGDSRLNVLLSGVHK